MNSEQSRQSRVNREQNDINANNCRTVNSRQFTHNSLLSTVRSHAFTLAETLIVMGIIGIVAALTIPNVNKNTNEAEKVAKVKKIYAELNEAHNRATAVYGPVETWFVNDNDWEQRTKRYFDRLTEFLKTTKICRNLDEGCMHCIYSNGDGFYKFRPNYLNHHWGDYDVGTEQAILSNGMSFAIAFWSDDIEIAVDIDGPNRGEYMWGKDVFLFKITENGISPYYSPTECANDLYSCILDDNSAYHSTWVLEKGNMDYLKVNPSTLKCPNGETFTWEKGSCK